MITFIKINLDQSHSGRSPAKSGQQKRPLTNNNNDDDDNDTYTAAGKNLFNKYVI